MSIKIERAESPIKSIVFTDWSCDKVIFDIGSDFVRVTTSELVNGNSVEMDKYDELPELIKFLQEVYEERNNQ